MPGGEVVGREVGIEERQPVADDQRLVGDGGERPAGEVVTDAFLTAAGLGPASGPKRSPFGFGVVDALGPEQQPLGEHRQVSQGVRAEVRAVHGHGPPAGQLEPLGGAGLRHRGFGGLAGDVVVEVQEREHHPDAPLIELPAERRRADTGEEGTRERREDAGPVARETVGGDRGAVTDTGQPVEGQVDDRARRFAGDVGDEADAAPVEFGHAQTILMRGHGLLAGVAHGSAGSRDPRSGVPSTSRNLPGTVGQAGATPVSRRASYRT